MNSVDLKNISANFKNAGILFKCAGIRFRGAGICFKGARNLFRCAGIRFRCAGILFRWREILVSAAWKGVSAFSDLFSNLIFQMDTKSIGSVKYFFLPFSIAQCWQFVLNLEPYYQKCYWQIFFCKMLNFITFSGESVSKLSGSAG